MKFTKNRLFHRLFRRHRIFLKIKRVHHQQIFNELSRIKNLFRLLFEVGYSRKKARNSSRLLGSDSNWKAGRTRFFRRTEKKDFMYNGSFQEAVAPVLLLAQVFAMMPVGGITSKTARELTFSFKSWRALHSSLYGTIIIGVLAVFTWCWASTQSFTFDSIERSCFYSAIFLMADSFLNLSRKWPQLMIKWETVENQLPPLRSQLRKRELAHQIQLIAIVISLLSLAEHIFFMLSGIYYANACPVRPDPIESYLLSSFSQVFIYIEYSHWLAAYGKYLNILSTFVWNFTDMFILVISVGLSSKFLQLNENLFEMAEKPTSEDFWTSCRINYRNLCRLCEKVDDVVSCITLVGMYLLASKHQRMLSKKYRVFFWFSLFYVLGKTLAVSLYSADIHDESRRPLQALRNVPRESWCEEIKRYSLELSTDMVALSGMKFFYLKRPLILSIAATVVTYELVLLQFNNL